MHLVFWLVLSVAWIGHCGGLKIWCVRVGLRLGMFRFRCSVPLLDLAFVAKCLVRVQHRGLCKILDLRFFVGLWRWGRLCVGLFWNTFFWKVEVESWEDRRVVFYYFVLSFSFCCLRFSRRCLRFSWRSCRSSLFCFMLSCQFFQSSGRLLKFSE